MLLLLFHIDLISLDPALPSKNPQLEIFPFSSLIEEEEERGGKRTTKKGKQPTRWPARRSPQLNVDGHAAPHRLSHNREQHLHSWIAGQNHEDFHLSTEGQCRADWPLIPFASFASFC